MGTLNDKLLELHSLPVGWDGYDGVPTTDSCLNLTKSILDRIYAPNLSTPYLTPSSDGSLQIEWYENGFDLAIQVWRDDCVTASRYDFNSGELIEIEVTNDFRQLDQWLSELSDSDRLH